MKDINELLRRCGISSKKKHLYIEALTHGSYANESEDNVKNYQRLEILGDAIVQKLITEYFYKKYPEFSDADISSVRKKLVQSSTMIKASNELDLISYALLGKGINIEKDTKKIREDIFESFIGAIYLDQGENKCFQILNRTLIKYFLKNELNDVNDYKSTLQEFFQTNEGFTKNKIQYKLISNDNNIFIVELVFNEITYGVGEGKTKKEAEQNAAKNALSKCNNKLS